MLSAWNRAAARLLAAAVCLVLPLSLTAASETGAEVGALTGVVHTRPARWRESVVVSLQRPGLAVAPAREPAIMDQRGMRFVPHVLAIPAGTTVRFLNSDPEPHNVYSPEGRYNLGTWPSGEVREHRFDRPGAYTQLCRVHPDMEAFVVVLDTPYYATTDAAGAFAIADIPPGEYQLTAWSERLEPVRRGVVIRAREQQSVSLEMP